MMHDDRNQFAQSARPTLLTVAEHRHCSHCG